MLCAHGGRGEEAASCERGRVLRGGEVKRGVAHTYTHTPTTIPTTTSTSRCLCGCVYVLTQPALDCGVDEGEGVVKEGAGWAFFGVQGVELCEGGMHWVREGLKTQGGNRGGA